MTGYADVPRQLHEGDIGRAVEVMAAAFHQDPLWVHFVPDEVKRAMYLRRFFEFFLTITFAGQEAFGLGEPLEAVAVWDTPEPHEHPAKSSPRKAYLKVLFSPLFPLILKTLKIFDHFEEMQKKHAPDRHFYLVAIGVSPGSQGKGLASRLIRHGFTNADARGMGAYLETLAPRNVPIYEHLGFELKEKWGVPKTSLSTWALYRPPSSG